MGWASAAIDELRRGSIVHIRPRGHSMRPRVNDRALCTLEPAQWSPVLGVGDIVLCRVRGREYLHSIRAIRGDRFQIGNNRGRINGWIGRHAIYGRLVRVEP